jgi:dipeptidyl aminopeptidase/acylaminoacyl peptidase
MVLVYPVISMADGTGHAGSRARLLGPSPDADAVKTYSTHLQVTEETPTTFLVLADDDRSVIPENSLRFYQALRESKVPAELHIFRRGGHGFSMRKAADRPVGAWVQLCEAWLAAVRDRE